MKAVKEINFLPDYVLEKEIKAKKKAFAIFMSLIALLVLISFYLIPKAVAYQYQKQEEKVKSEFTQYAGVQKKIAELRQIQDSKSKKQTSLDKINKKQIKITAIINKISGGIPSNVKVKSYNIVDKEISMSFMINSPNDSIELIKSLENLGIFERVTINNLPIVDMNYLINFRLKLKDLVDVKL